LVSYVFKVFDNSLESLNPISLLFSVIWYALKLYYYVITGSQHSTDSEEQIGSDSELKEINDYNCTNKDGIMDIEYQKQLTTITEWKLFYNPNFSGYGAHNHI
jgi:hypothetical protein